MQTVLRRRESNELHMDLPLLHCLSNVQAGPGSCKDTVSCCLSSPRRVERVVAGSLWLGRLFLALAPALLLNRPDLPI